MSGVQMHKFPDQQMERLKLQSYGDTGLEWELTSPSGEGYSEDGRTIVKNMMVTLYENAQKSTTVKADEGVMFGNEAMEANGTTLDISTYNVKLQAGDMFLNGNVVVVSTDGSRMTTDWAHFKKKANLIVSSAPVQITREDSTTRGVGLEATPDLSSVKIFNETLVIPDRTKN